jgi:multidrug resistance efflux pump
MEGAFMKNMKIVYFVRRFISCICLIPLLALANSPVLITGKITSAKQQIITAPKTTRWQIQVQWMLEEGKVAEKGDLVTVFDSGSIETQIQQDEERLESELLVLEKQKLDFQQAVIEAKGSLNVALLEVEKARIEASITSAEVSQYDKGQYQVTLERALFNKIKAEQTYEVKKQEQITELEKQNIEILKLKENIDYQKKMLDKIAVKAQFSGPVTHMMHPWNGEKIAPGTTVQASMSVMLVQGQGSFEVEAWLHEIDANKVKVGDKAILTLDAFSAENHNGRVTSLTSQTEKKAQWSDSSYYLVKISFDKQPEQTLLPGMSVRVLVNKDMTNDQ